MDVEGLAPGEVVPEEVVPEEAAPGEVAPGEVAPMVKRKTGHLALLLVALLVAAYFAARHLVAPGPPAPDPEGLPAYPAREAAEHAGEVARICGTVVDATYAPRVQGRPTFLNLEEPYPDPVFTAVIWGEDRGRFAAPPERAYAGRRICVAGRIESYEGRPEIIVRHPRQIAAAPERP